MTDLLRAGMDSRTAKTTRVEALAISLRTEILLGLRYPRERLAEVALAEEHKVSRGTIREALQRLAAMGFVVGEPHRGFSVREFTYDDVIGLGEVFAMLELQATKSIQFPVSTATLDIMRESAEAMEELELPRDWDALWELDRKFHGSLVAESKNPWLLDTWQRLQPFLSVITVPLLRPGVPYPGQLATARHLELLEAIAGGDVSVARRAIEDHYHQHDEHMMVPEQRAVTVPKRG